MSMSSSSRRLEAAGTSTSPEHKRRSLGGREQHWTQNVMRYTATILHPTASRPTWHFEVREFQITENPPIRMLPRQQPLVPESESIKYEVGGDNYNITASGPDSRLAPNRMTINPIMEYWYLLSVKSIPVDNDDIKHLFACDLWYPFTYSISIQLPDMP